MIPGFADAVLHKNIDLAWDSELDCPATLPCDHKSQACSRRAISQWTAVNLVKKKVTGIDFLNIFKVSLSLTYSTAAYSKISNADVFLTKKFWPSLPNYSLATPNKVFVIDEITLKTDFCGFVSDGIYKKPKARYIYDYDGIGVIEALPTEQCALHRDQYLEKLLLSLTPLGVNGEKRENLCRSELGIIKDSPYCQLLGHSLF